MKDPRFAKINQLFINYSLGKFDYKIKPSSRLDEVDAFISNVNMLGEELKTTTISRNYFNKIFNSVSDTIFIIDRKGKLTDINKAGARLFRYSMEELLAMNLFDLFKNGNEKKLFLKEIKNKQSIVNKKIKLKDKKGKVIEGMISARKMKIQRTGELSYQGIIKDMTKEKEMENLVRRTILDTEERERERIAKDLHDDLRQKLFMIIGNLSTLKSEHDYNSRESKKIFSVSTKELQNIYAELRTICFNIMPSILRKFGLVKAIDELCRNIELTGKIKFEKNIDEKISLLEKSLEVSIFRIIQEFINNAIRHGRANIINIALQKKTGILMVSLKDNGIGFDKKILNGKNGMGLMNVQSRVESFNGEIMIESSPGKGTFYHIEIPVK